MSVVAEMGLCPVKLPLLQPDLSRLSTDPEAGGQRRRRSQMGLPTAMVALMDHKRRGPEEVKLPHIDQQNKSLGNAVPGRSLGRQKIAEARSSMGKESTAVIKHRMNKKRASMMMSYIKDMANDEMNHMSEETETVEDDHSPRSSKSPKTWGRSSSSEVVKERTRLSGKQQHLASLSKKSGEVAHESWQTMLQPHERVSDNITMENAHTVSTSIKQAGDDAVRCHAWFLRKMQSHKEAKVIGEQLGMTRRDSFSGKSDLHSQVDEEVLEAYGRIAERLRNRRRAGIAERLDAGFVPPGKILSSGHGCAHKTSKSSAKKQAVRFISKDRFSGPIDLETVSEQPSRGPSSKEARLRRTPTLTELPGLRSRFHDHSLIYRGFLTNDSSAQASTSKRHLRNLAKKLGLTQEEWEWDDSCYNPAHIEAIAERKRERQLNSAAEKIQNQWHDYSTRRRSLFLLEKLRSSVLQVEAWWHVLRAFKAPIRRRILRRKVCTKAAIRIQAHVRGILTRQLVQGKLELQRVLSGMQDLQTSLGPLPIAQCLRIQAAYRGHCVRKCKELERRRQLKAEEEERFKTPPLPESPSGANTPTRQRSKDKGRKASVQIVDSLGNRPGKSPASRLRRQSIGIVLAQRMCRALPDSDERNDGESAAGNRMVRRRSTSHERRMSANYIDKSQISQALLLKDPRKRRASVPSLFA